MKVHVTFKTPDALDMALDEACLNDYGNDQSVEDIKDEARQICEKWIKYGEYVTLEIDTTQGTATVLEQ